jgi:HAD superfamily hydrolase (TIGR01509 family)
MVKVILSDLARTFLFVKDKNWTETLNKLYAQLEDKNEPYDFWQYFEVDHDYLEIMKQLKQTYKVNMFTSGYIQNQSELHALLVPIFENIFNEEIIEYKKSQKEAYKVIADKLGVEPGEILFIDDDPNYIEAARDIGFNVFRMINNEDLKTFLKETLEIDLL